MPILLYLKLAGLGAAALGLVWLVDEIGDRREAKVRAGIARQVAEANARAEDAERKWKARYESDTAERARDTADALAGIRSMASGTCAMPPGLIDRLNRITPRAR